MGSPTDDAPETRIYGRDPGLVLRQRPALSIELRPHHGIDLHGRASSRHFKHYFPPTSGCAGGYLDEEPEIIDPFSSPFVAAFYVLLYCKDILVWLMKQIRGHH